MPQEWTGNAMVRYIYCLRYNMNHQNQEMRE